MYRGKLARQIKSYGKFHAWTPSSAASVSALESQHVIVLVPCGLASRSNLKLIILLNNENLVNSWLKSDVSYAISVSFEVPFKEVIKLGMACS